MQSLKDDAQHQHSTFLEYTIVLLIGFEVLVEMHAMGWIDLLGPDITSMRARFGQADPAAAVFAGPTPAEAGGTPAEVLTRAPSATRR